MLSGANKTTAVRSAVQSSRRSIMGDGESFALGGAEHNTVETGSNTSNTGYKHFYVTSGGTKMEKMIIFSNADFGEVRTLTINSEPWFVGRDICKMFGDKNESRSLSRIGDEDKMVMSITDSLGRPQKAIFVNESGMYSLLFSMQPEKTNHNGTPYAYPTEVQERIEKLRRFKRWVTSEVLPAIRKHGVYAVDDMLADPDRAIQALTTMKAEREKLGNYTMLE